MAYDIELISIGEDLYPILRASARMLNAVQSEFRFRLPSEQISQEGLTFRRNDYTTGEIWNFLREQRDRLGGYRPYVIAFVNRPLKSSELSNIFGSHEGLEGLAVVTLHSSSQYVRETKRYCCYYLTRYTLSFVNPFIRSHNDPERKSCYFHRKLYKPEIRASMDSAVICDEDMRQLDSPSPREGAHKLSSEEKEALLRMRQVVSGDYPFALVMKGGGIKGLAFAGALLELEKYFWFDRHVGTSAGAIAAALLAGGYSPAELAQLLSSKDFREFLDAPFWKLPLNLLTRRGFYPGDHFRKWIATLLRSKIEKQSDIVMSDLSGAILYACTPGSGTLVFDSTGSRKDSLASFAVRCSMSIPVFFTAEQIDGRRVYDGGLRNNFPVLRFLNDHPDTPFIALYLTAANRDRRWTGGELLDIFIEGEERGIVDRYASDMVLIDTNPVRTLDFKLDEVEKQFLTKVGRAAALRFLFRKNLDGGPTQDEVESADREAEEARDAVRSRRKKKRIRRVIALLTAALITWGLAGPLRPWLAEGLHSIVLDTQHRLQKLSHK